MPDEICYEIIPREKNHVKPNTKNSKLKDEREEDLPDEFIKEKVGYRVQANQSPPRQKALISSRIVNATPINLMALFNRAEQIQQLTDSRNNTLQKKIGSKSFTSLGFYRN